MPAYFWSVVSTEETKAPLSHAQTSISITRASASSCPFSLKLVYNYGSGHQRLYDWLINYIDTKAKGRHLKKIDLGLCGRFYQSGAPSPPRFEVREATAVQKARSKLPTWLTVSPVSKLWWTPASKSLYRSNFLDDDILLWCLYTWYCMYAFWLNIVFLPVVFDTLLCNHWHICTVV